MGVGLDGFLMPAYLVSLSESADDIGVELHVLAPAGVADEHRLHVLGGLPTARLPFLQVHIPIVFDHEVLVGGLVVLDLGQTLVQLGPPLQILALIFLLQLCLSLQHYLNYTPADVSAVSHLRQTIAI